MKSGLKIFTIIAMFAANNSLWSATFTYQALEDFTDINAGEITYIRDNNFNALAINAAIESNREKFARATLEFTEDEDIYDVTITTLGEIDGEGEYRFLVDGVIVGSAVNVPTTEDFSEQHHTFENITIPTGALIGVESIAVSNGLIPENGAYAYARGRWRTLTVATVADDDTGTADPAAPVDLSITVSANNSQATLGEELSYTIEAENLSATVATNPVVELSLAPGVSSISSDSCSVIDTTTLVCNLAELPANESINFTVTVLATTVGDNEVTAEISADQQDNATSNNSDSVTTVVAAPVADDESVDLQLTLSADKEQLDVGENLTYVVTISNLHNTNTATSPTVGVVLSDSLQFLASDKCNANQLVVTCNLEELTPGQTTTAEFTATAVKVNSFSLALATASSAQFENDVSNNDSQLVTVISSALPENVVPTTDQPIDTNAATTNLATSNSGGGVFQDLPLVIYVLLWLFSRSIPRHPKPPVSRAHKESTATRMA